MTTFDAGLFDGSIFAVGQSAVVAQPKAPPVFRRKRKMAHRERHRNMEAMISRRRR